MMPKLVYQEVVNCYGIHYLEVDRRLSRDSLWKLSNIFSSENIYKSTFHQDGTFCFSCFIGLSPAEVSFVATSSFMNRLLFSVMRTDSQFLDGTSDLLLANDEDDIQCDCIGKFIKKKGCNRSCRCSIRGSNHAVSG